jgi:hypothetical protein
MEKKFVISKSDILSAVACCGIEQSPYIFPKNLQDAITALSNKIDAENIFASPIKLSASSYRVFIDEQAVLNLIDHLIKDTPEIAIWNVTQKEQYNGITDARDPQREIKNILISRCSIPPEDDDFIDLDALVRNILAMLKTNQE